MVDGRAMGTQNLDEDDHRINATLAASSASIYISSRARVSDFKRL